MKLWGFIKKENLLISRDIHALSVLFVMPIVFILIMSFALQNSFSGEVARKYRVALIGGGDLLSLDSTTFELISLEKTRNNINSTLYKSDFDFILTISDVRNSMDIYVKSSVSSRYVRMLQAEIALMLQEKMLQSISKRVGMKVPQKTDFKVHFMNKTGVIHKITSVDQSVPSWLIFSMFFILIPMSNTFMNERAFGTLDRFKSMSFSIWTLLLGKFIPYLCVNQIQVLIMFLVGIYLMPLLGLDSLNIRGGLGLLIIMSLCTSFAAIAFGLLIANIAKTSEEATTLGGVSNIIFAAIGGIMVPKFVMPPAMQNVSEFSPMSWSLDGFFSIIIKNENFYDIAPNLGKLLLFTTVCLLMSYLLLKKKESVR